MSFRRRVLRRNGIQNYIPKAIDAAKPGMVNIVDVFHDHSCPRLKGGECNCDPDVRAVHLGPVPK